MRLEVLGPLRVTVGGQEIPVTARRERVLLAMLALQAGRTVPPPDLVDALWPERPPKDARSQLQGCVSRLRRALAGGGAHPDVIATDPAGYRLRVDPQALDVGEFRALRDRARAAAAAGQPAEASDHYRAALGLWRGPALSGVASDRVIATAAALDEERVLLLEECIPLELGLGRSGELVSELSGLVQQHPYREGLYAALMLALYRAGRPADALATYRRAHQLLHDELGAAPGSELQRLHRAILNRDPELAGPRHRSGAGPAGASAPRELPHEVAGFTGRAGALKALDELLPDPAGAGPAPVPIAVVTGPAGVGKTALAVYWAHRVADRFPDGQLYFDLRGYDLAAPVRPIEALAALLRSLGTPPAEVPADPAGAAAQYRSRLAGRRVLVVLDNAGTADQVRPLVPGSPGCLVLVTSRDRLTGLAARDGASRFVLDPLPPGEAWTMLARSLGLPRAEAERAAVSELARLCAYLPLALRIAAANLADHPNQTVGGYVAELAAGDRLSALRAGGDEQSAVRAAFDLSYRVLPDPARRLFRRIGLVPGPDFPAPVAAVVAGTTVDEAERLLGALAAGHLVEEPTAGRYTCHDLLRRYATQLVETDPAPERARATERLLAGYLHTADAAARLLNPQLLLLPARLPDGRRLAGIDRPADALAWLDAERASLVAAVTHAAEHGQPSAAWLLSDRLRGYLRHRRYTIDWLTVARAAAAAAAQAGDPWARAAAEFSLADVHQHLSRHPEAVAHYTAAFDRAGQAGWQACQAAALNNLGLVYQELGEVERSVDHYGRALTINQRLGDLSAQAVNLVNLAGMECVRGRLRAGADHLTEALALNRRLGSQHGEAAAANSLANTYRAMGRPDEARGLFTSALERFRGTGDRAGEAAARHGLAAVQLDTGRYSEAAEHAQQAATLAAEIGDPAQGSHALRALGRVQLRLGRTARALACHQESVELARRARSRFAETIALVRLAEATLATGGAAAARELAEQALAHASTSGYRVYQADALVVLAEIHLARGDHPAAREHADRGLALHRETGCRPGEDRARQVLDRLGPTGGGPDGPGQDACSGQTQACTQRQPSARRS